MSTVGFQPTRAEPAPFRLGDDLPAGTTLLEASAGTGKTYTIANLAVRYLAEGTPIEQLLVVTFTRLATGELRERVRTRLAGAEAALRMAGSDRGRCGDELVDLLAAGPPEEVAERRRRLSEAVADFDAATITTIHGLCEQMLASLGTAADSGRDLRFVDDLSDLVDEVVDDLYLRKFFDSDEPPIDRREAHAIVALAVANRHATIVPAPATGPAATTPGLRASLALRGRHEVLRRARLAGLLSYDDQLDLVQASLYGPSGQAAVDRLRSRFSVVLVDEFQDTDPVQWDIFHTAFADAGIPLLLIGDPKQAIYGFRGADVWAYLAAAATAERRCTLATNWRTDKPLVDALDAVLAGATLGHEDIPYRRVTAAPGHETSQLRGAPDPAALRLRLLHRGDGLVETTRYGWAQAGSTREVVAADAAADIVSLLSSGATIVDGQERPVRPGDIAVLVRANSEAVVVNQALDRVGVPSVIPGAGSVLATGSAAHWLTLLEALEQPASQTRVRAATLTPFVGWDPARLAAAGDDELDEVQATLHRWAAVLAGRGVAALAATMAAEVGLEARELARPGGERRLTDLGHVAELLHAEALASGSGVRALTAWLREGAASAATDASPEDRSRRLETDAEAVQVQTIHSSKGLEYPIVYLPFLWLAFPDKDPFPVFHDPAAGNRRTIDVGGARPEGFEPNKRRAGEERRGEELRLAYVALTRARQQVVAWWATGVETKSSPLARLLLGHGRNLTRPVELPGDDDGVADRLTDLAARAGPGLVSVARVAAPARRRWLPPDQQQPDLGVSAFTRSIDTAWSRASYTSITAAAHGDAPAPVVGSEAEQPGLTDEPTPSDDGQDSFSTAAALGAEAASTGAALGAEAASTAAALGAEAASRALASPMADLPGGPAFGVAVHAVFEGVDFTAADLRAALDARIGAVARTHRAGTTTGFDRSTLAAALESTLTTPLGPLAAGLSLRDIGPGDRLDELGFELPLVGGDAPTASLAVADVAACLRRWLGPDDPLAAYPDRLEGPQVAATLRGFLTGSIDLVARVTTPEGPRHLVVDYKTNWLGPPGGPLTVWDYRQERMAEEMAEQHYPLQAVLYSVALHRFLRWRLPGYVPERHLGGILYLFVRGMAGPATPEVGGGTCGVFAWRPPGGMIVELSDLLDAGAAT